MSYHTLTSTSPLEISFFLLKLTKKRLIFLLTFFLLLPLFAFYLFQIADLVRISWLEKNLVQEIEEISQENLILEAKVITFKSFGEVEKEVENLGFVEVEEIKYIPISPEYLVKE